MNLLKRHRYETPSVTVKVDTRDLVGELEETRSVVHAINEMVKSLQLTQANQHKEIELLTDIVVEREGVRKRGLNSHGPLLSSDKVFMLVEVNKDK